MCSNIRRLARVHATLELGAQRTPRENYKVIDMKEEPPDCLVACSVNLLLFQNHQETRFDFSEDCLGLTG